MTHYVVRINIRDAYRWAQPNLCSFLYFQEQRQISDHKILRITLTEGHRDIEQHEAANPIY